jgi:hypothetical protein
MKFYQLQPSGWNQEYYVKWSKPDTKKLAPVLSYLWKLKNVNVNVEKWLVEIEKGCGW